MSKRKPPADPSEILAKTRKQAAVTKSTLGEDERRRAVVYDHFRLYLHSNAQTSWGVSHGPYNTFSRAEFLRQTADFIYGEGQGVKLFPFPYTKRHTATFELFRTQITLNRSGTRVGQGFVWVVAVPSLKLPGLFKHKGSQAIDVYRRASDEYVEVELEGPPLPIGPGWDGIDRFSSFSGGGNFHPDQWDDGTIGSWEGVLDY